MSYTVLNPRKIPKGVCVLSTGSGDTRKEWQEGDTYDGPNPGDLVKRGFLKEAKGGRTVGKDERSRG